MTSNEVDAADSTGGDKMKKRIQKLPDSELDVMLALWNGHPDMTRLEVEAFVNQKKELAPTTILSMLTRLESKKFVSVKREGKTNLYSAVVTQSEYQQQEGKSVLEKLYGNSLKNRGIEQEYKYGRRGESSVSCRHGFMNRRFRDCGIPRAAVHTDL